MSNDRIYRYSIALAGINAPFVTCGIGSRFGSISSAVIELPYSPYILHIHEQTKIQIWEQLILDGTIHEPTLEFDGIVVGIVRSKNFAGNVSARLTCSTDGIIWNRRKQFDFYLSNITEVNVAHTGDVISMRADGAITNFFADVLQNNRFDAGCAAASVLTSLSYGKYIDGNVYPTYYEYFYNGKKFFRKLQKDGNSATDLTPPYYRRFLQEYKLVNKVYGVSTSVDVQKFFQQDRFIKLVTNNVQDLLGENSFWSIATQVLSYGFYSVYDIPNPTFIPGDSKALSEPGKDINSFAQNVQTNANNSTDRQVQLSNQNASTILPSPGTTTALNPEEYADVNISDKRMFHGLAEYIMKPISVLGLPLECNIIWPEQIKSDSIFYDFINSPTRVIMTKKLLPGVTDNEVLTTQKIVGPFIQDKEGFFASFTAPSQKVRTASSDSDYEKQYGINYHQLDLSFAFDSVLLSNQFQAKQKPSASDIDNLGTKMNNFLNYEFSQRYFSSRNYNVQVTPDVNVVPGLPVILLDKRGEHIIAFVTGVNKSFDATGNKNVEVSISYPRFYYEDIGALGNVVDPSSTEAFAAAELALLFGSEPLVPAGALDKLPGLIEEIFAGYMQLDNDDQRSDMRQAYTRKVCTFAQFIQFYKNINVQDKITIPPNYLTDVFASTTDADNLTCHTFRAYVGGVVEENKGVSNQSIIRKHLDWTSQAQVI